MFVVAPFFTYRYYLLHTRVSVGDMPRAGSRSDRDDRRFWFGNEPLQRRSTT